MNYSTKHRPDLNNLRAIPILDVVHSLKLELVRTGTATWHVKGTIDNPDDTKGYTSLCVFEQTNSWYRFSGKNFGGVSKGSVIDLVMHINDCSFQRAVDFLASYFPNYT